MKKEIRFEQMQCPHCGNEMGTYGHSCICGYNPMTNKVENPPLLKNILDRKNFIDNTEEFGIDLNVYDLIKKHYNIQTIFWSPLLGNVKVSISNDDDIIIHYNNNDILLDKNCLDYVGNYALYPSEKERNWIKWDEELTGKFVVKANIEFYDKNNPEVKYMNPICRAVRFLTIDDAMAFKQKLETLFDNYK